MQKLMMIVCVMCCAYLANAQGTRLPSENDTCKVFLPSAFTPNSDGLNDKLNILSACGFDEAVLEVYNRWGDLIYVSTSQEDGWDGVSQGQEQPGGTYIWVVKYIRDSEESITKGTVALLR
ncbi:MAG: gliding motility-associated C-terminal domain-containing protein [Chitinophagales bacterium]|nr:gliding motility-associated C-terminal domain-containing protein [Chitinophagales bacterium]